MEVFPLVSPEISLAIFSSIFSAVVSSIAAILVYKLQNRDHKRELEELERKAESQRLEDKRQREFEALKNGVQSMLRDRLIQSALSYERQGWVDTNSLENIGLMFSAYSALGGNGIVAKLFNEIQELPHVNPNKDN